MVMMLMVNGGDDGASRGKDNLTNPTWQPSIGPDQCTTRVSHGLNIFGMSACQEIVDQISAASGANTDIGRRYAL